MAFSNFYQDENIPSPVYRFWLTFSSNPLSLIGLWGVSVLIIIAIAGPLLAPYSPELQNPAAISLPPSWDQQGQVAYFLGTDDLGRDLLSRLLYGAQYTFGLAVLVVIVALIIGFLIGAFSGMTQGLKSSVMSHLFDAMMSIPSLLMAILVVAVTGPGLQEIFWAVGIALVPQFVRAIYQAVHDELQKEYVTAARLDGASQWQIFWYVIMPNVWDTIVIQTTLAMSAAILDIAALGFLGLGAQAPSPEWGAMVAQGAEQVLISPWLVTLPGLAILFTVLSVNLVGDGLRSALKPENR